MTMNIIEKILTAHSKKDTVTPEEIIDINIDTRAARDFGGANVVKNLEDYDLPIHDPSKTFFTFDTNPTGSDQKYAKNQQIIRQFARKRGIKIYDINNGIGTHTMISEGLAWPGSTALTTDSHANILGAIGAFGQGMGDKDIAAAMAYGKVWFKVPKSVKLTFKGKRPENVTAKDIVLNLLNQFGANSLLGYSVEMYGEAIDQMPLDERITISSMGTEMGAIIVLFPPNEEIMEYCQTRTQKEIPSIKADEDATYDQELELDISTFRPMVSRPGKPHDVVDIGETQKVKIDSAFVGSCTNGRMSDMYAVAEVLKDKKVAPGVVLKIVPATDKIWQQCLEEGIIDTFKKAGALVSNAGCAGCAAGQVGQNGPGEVTISTGNRNFPGKQGKGEVYLASPSVVAASAVSGYITTTENIPPEPAVFEPMPEEQAESPAEPGKKKQPPKGKPTVVEGRVWIIDRDNIDTDMIFHNRYLSITDPKEMAKYTFDNLDGYEDFASKSQPGDIIITGKNFGAGSSRQQAVECFKELGISAILAESYGAIYERNAINAALPIMKYSDLTPLELNDGDKVQVNFETGEITNLSNNKVVQGEAFSEVQMEIYKNGGLF
ncbi:MAG: 3-isopropylmalate dehydratase large subunit [Bacteroidales bacterium]|nr:3-isopropylmalate dehydratase large subunit [Bacteroidales bacterium]MCF8334519.1 3-isopropylmalate dehydratase large subunit [Bacteroidales bacterium]